MAYYYNMHKNVVKKMTHEYMDIFVSSTHLQHYA